MQYYNRTFAKNMLGYAKLFSSEIWTSAKTIMAKQSKFQDKQVDTLLNELIAVFEKHQTPVDLSLVVLGNMVTNVLKNNMGQQQRIVLAQAFSDALMNSLKEKK